VKFKHTIPLIVTILSSVTILVSVWQLPAAAYDPVKPEPPTSSMKPVRERPKVVPVPGPSSTVRTPTVLQSSRPATLDGPVAQAVADGAAWPIANYIGDACIVARGGADNEPVVKTPCMLAYIDQYWSFVPVGGGYYQVRNANSGKCLLTQGKVSETPAVQYACHGFTDQQWAVIEDTTGRYFMLQNRNSGLCLVMRTSENRARQVICDWRYIDQWWLRGMPYAPPRTSDMSKPVYFIHGYSDTGTGFDANGVYWDNMISDYTHDGSPSGFTGPIARKWTYCYYANDTNCDIQAFGGDRNRPIKTIAADLAWDIYDRFSKFNVAVDVVGHSMGGLAIRAALTGVEKADPAFPPYLYVEDVTTLSTPHRGANWAALCPFTQCVDMRAGSSFLAWLYDDPQGWSGTDWTVVGFDDDIFVPAWSAAPDNMWVSHKVIYTDGQILPPQFSHMDLLERTSGSYRYIYCDIFSTGCNLLNRNTFYQVSGGMDPARMSRFGVFFEFAY
jgi:hypothetical protein